MCSNRNRAWATSNIPCSVSCNGRSSASPRRNSTRSGSSELTASLFACEIWSRSRSIPTTWPSSPTVREIRRVNCPTPQPRSRTFSPGRRSSSLRHDSFNKSLSKDSRCCSSGELPMNILRCFRHSEVLAIALLNDQQRTIPGRNVQTERRLECPRHSECPPSPRSGLLCSWIQRRARRHHPSFRC